MVQVLSLHSLVALARPVPQGGITVPIVEKGVGKDDPESPLNLKLLGFTSGQQEPLLLLQNKVRPGGRKRARAPSPEHHPPSPKLALALSRCSLALPTSSRPPPGFTDPAPSPHCLPAPGSLLLQALTVPSPPPSAPLISSPGSPSPQLGTASFSRLLSAKPGHRPLSLPGHWSLAFASSILQASTLSSPTCPLGARDSLTPVSQRGHLPASGPLCTSGSADGGATVTPLGPKESLSGQRLH